ncbi:MAG: LPS export ABC transporter periplasmic protein LptC [Kiloniellales bacterium]
MVQVPNFSENTAAWSRRLRRRDAVREDRGGPTQIPRPPHRRGLHPPRFSGRNAYSLFVVVLKVVLPAFAAALVLLVVVWPQLNPDDSRFRIGVTRISLSQAENLSMMNARYDGIDKESRPFTITADLATQESANADIVDLELPKADITLEDGTWLVLTAKTGRYRREAETVELNDNVVVFHDQGFEVRTDAATIFLKEGAARGSSPVQGQGPSGLLTSEGFQLINRGERIIFTGKSRLVLYSESQEALP